MGLQANRKVTEINTHPQQHNYVNGNVYPIIKKVMTQHASMQGLNTTKLSIVCGKEKKVKKKCLFK